MTACEKSKGGGGRLARSETVTVRLDPKLRYLTELAALKHRRTLSSFIEWAIEDSLHRVKLREGTGYNNDSGSTVSDDAESLWDVDDADRFAKLALRYPDLLTHEEQKRWKLIRENGYLWRGRYGSDDKWGWTVKEQSLMLDRLREYWDRFCAVVGTKLKLPSFQLGRTRSQIARRPKGSTMTYPSSQMQPQLLRQPRKS
jgi:hypothetical protein